MCSKKNEWFKKSKMPSSEEINVETLQKLPCSFAKDREIPIKIEMFSYVKNWMRKSRRQLLI